ncbi:GTP 3',8-cyclase MoaA [Pseudophaeobacter sp. EL27]|uniref:GTP 3',8-cyclase MoaA n=1 Tax=Pseudophaeobacter sp. EL27 TaxID=2107580 RepID=UPI000EFAB41C|nr:GTP 3',8-cyclase MoaA [Pseudophaeobacter sp. EL27]
MPLDACTRKTLSDSFGREVNYLRLSVTDRCDLRCTYCMAERMTFLPKRELLSIEELEKLVGAFIDLGVRKLRLTGGEPLVRHGIMSLIEKLGHEVATGRLAELTLTTNGTQLTRFAPALASNGVRRINVSLDTLNPEKFAKVTRRGRLDQVLQGIEAARAAGLQVKINTMGLRGFNDAEIPDLVDWALERGCDLAFIEVMPMGEVEVEDRLGQYWPLGELRSMLEERFTLRDTSFCTGGPSRYCDVLGTQQRIGFITPMSHNFCASCNRVRVNCRGELFTCLGREGSCDLRPALRDSTDISEVHRAIRSALSRKPKGHDFAYAANEISGAVSRGMNHTGG